MSSSGLQALEGEAAVRLLCLSLLEPSLRTMETLHPSCLRVPLAATLWQTQRHLMTSELDLCASSKNDMFFGADNYMCFLSVPNVYGLYFSCGTVSRGWRCRYCQGGDGDGLEAEGHTDLHLHSSGLLHPQRNASLRLSVARQETLSELEVKNPHTFLLMKTYKSWGGIGYTLAIWHLVAHWLMITHRLIISSGCGWHEDWREVSTTSASEKLCSTYVTRVESREVKRL